MSCAVYICTGNVEQPDAGVEAYFPNQTTTDVSAQVKELRGKFETLALSCLSELEKQHLGLRKFRTSLTLLPATIKFEHTDFLKENLPTFLKANSLEEIFVHLNLYWNFIDYSLLDYIINHFCSDDLKKDMKDYKSDLEKFRKATTVSQVIDIWHTRVDLPPNFTQFASTLDRDASTFTLEELEELRTKICNKFSLSSFMLMFHSVVNGSLIVNWLVPSNITPQLRRSLLEKAKSKSLFFEENAIISISIDGECVSLFLPHVQAPANSLSHHTYKKEYRQALYLLCVVHLWVCVCT